jgi:hypothetical protein
MEKRLPGLMVAFYICGSIALLEGSYLQSRDLGHFKGEVISSQFLTKTHHLSVLALSF